jgi:hypothetical protein
VTPASLIISRGARAHTNAMKQPDEHFSIVARRSQRSHFPQQQQWGNLQKHIGALDLALR